MHKTVLRCVCALFLLAAVPALASDIPDMTGTWQCSLEGIVRGDNIHYKGKDAGQIQLIEGQAEHVIEEQKGRRFWGYKGVKSGKRENMIGMVMTDNQSIVTVDHDGRANGKIISPTEYEEHYAHTWGQGKMAVFCVKCRKKQ